MKRAIQIGGIALAVIALLGMTAYAFANAPAKGSMGVWGYVVAEKNAKLELDADQGGAKAANLVVDRVLAPGDAWVVVHTDDNGMPGMRVGLKHVSAGETRDIVVPLEDVTTDKVIVAIHADKGTAGKFDFDMDKKTQSADRPFFVSGKELAKVVTVR
jgi:hypothetical protein